MFWLPIWLYIDTRYRVKFLGTSKPKTNQIQMATKPRAKLALNQMANLLIVWMCIHPTFCLIISYPILISNRYNQLVRNT